MALEVLFWPFVACLVLTGIHTYLGLHVVSRGVIFVDLALAQIAALGATFAFMLGFAVDGSQAYLYSLTFAFLGAAIFSVSRLRDQHIPQEAIIGISFAVASAAVILLADRSPEGAEFVEAMLTGALLWVPPMKIVETAVIYTAIGAFHWIFRRRFLALTLDPQRAEAEGWSVRWWDFWFYVSFGFVITWSVSIAGVLLVFSFLVIPSVIAMLFTRRIGSRLAIGWISGTAVSTVGLGLSFAYDFPSGPAVVCTFGLALILAAVGRYVAMAERPEVALAKVAAVAVVAAGGLWLAFVTSPTGTALAAAADDAAATEEASPPATADSPRERVAAALASLESAVDAPAPADVGVLLDAGENLHRMMTAGEVSVSENATRALVNAIDRDGVQELLAEIAYHADDPWAHLRAAEGLVGRRDPLGIEPLIDLIAEDNPLFLQLQAVQALRAATGQSFGYDPEQGAEAKSEAVARWRQWWNENRAAPFADATVPHR